MKVSTIQLTDDSKVTLTSYLLDKSEELSNADVRPGILIFSGGAYMACSDREAEPVAMAYLSEGYHAFVLRYTVGEKSVFPKPLEDAEAALSLIRANSKDWGVDSEKIAVVGFSAGGHLAAALGTMGKIRPNALILGYPCIIEEIGEILANPVPGLDTKVDKSTPATYIFATCNDELVPVENSIRFMDALNKSNIPFESHIFFKGNHGLSLAKAHTSSGVRNFVNPNVEKWFEMSVDWLHQVFGNFYAEGEAVAQGVISDAKEYGIDIPFRLLWNNEQCKGIILRYLPVLQDNKYLEATMGLSIRMINEYANGILDLKTLEDIDRELKTVSFVD